MSQQLQFDVLIIGSGAAGLSVSSQLSPQLQVAMIAKGPMDEGSTRYAQGGISAVLDSSDSLDSHIQDTLNTGAGLCDATVVRHVVKQGAKQIRWLLDLGMPFTTIDESTNHRDKHFHLTREGGHGHRRIIHAKDTTGRALSETLMDAVRQRPNIHLFDQYLAVDLISGKKLGMDTSGVLGAYVLNRNSGHIEVIRAQTIVLATGGASKVYLYTSNPDVSTGDGIAMAWRLGCRVANMEFIQFHPTCLYHPQAKSFLISEAVRGEGGKLLLPDGTPFMESIDPRAELAPRDIVARAIDHEMKHLGLDCVFLDISFKSDEFVKKHFPNIYQRCLAFGYNMAKEPLPVVPAAHYTCGGIMTDIHGRTDIKGLYAIGETAFTGLHGANRMASNSLLECLVFAASAAGHINDHIGPSRKIPRLPEWDESRVTNSDEEIVVAHNWDELRRFMWDYVGIVRTNKRLERAMRRVNLLAREIDEYYSNFHITNDLIELRNLVQIAEIIIQSAMNRRESRGLHNTLDYPQTINPAQNTILTPPNYRQSQNAASEDEHVSA